MLTFDYYWDQYKGNLSPETFEELLPKVEFCVMALIEKTVPYWKIHDGMIDELNINRDLCIQLDYLHSCGGIEAFNGQNMQSFSEIKTSNFTLSKKKDGNMSFSGIPFHSTAMSHILLELKRKGYLNRGLE